MKEIEAYIKPHKLLDVAMALQKVQRLRGMSVVEVKGFGRRNGKDVPHSAVNDLRDFAKYVKIEIFCHDDLADEIVSIINRTAYTGLRGDGRIYVSAVEKTFKIGKGEIVEADI